MKKRSDQYPLPGFNLYRSGFSLIELLVAIGVFLVLMSIFIPYAMKLRESSRRTRCADNLGQIGTALMFYARDHGGAFPRVVYDLKNRPNGYACFTGADDENPFSDHAKVQVNDVTASLWLLVRLKLAGPQIFVCPSTYDRQDPIAGVAGQSVSATSRGNFRKAFNLSYSYAVPFSAALEYRVDGDRPWAFALLADKNPGLIPPADSAPPLELARGNSLNHDRAGQNVLHPGGPVTFERSPYCGVGGDNIYTAQRETPLAAGEKSMVNGPGFVGSGIGPAWHHDSYLVPTESEGPR